VGEFIAGLSGVADPPPGPVTMPWTLHDPLGPPVDPALGGPLMVSPALGPGLAGRAAAGLVRVATDALLAHAERLTRLGELLGEDAARLGGLPVAGADLLALASPAARQSMHELQVCGTAVRAAADVARRADDDLRLAIDRYSENEQQQREAAIRLGEGLAVVLGPVIRNLALLGLPAVLAANVAGLGAAPQIGALRQWLLDNPELITSPAFVEVVRGGVMGMDDGLGSALGLPPGAAAALAAGAGFSGVQAGAAYLLGAGRPLGFFRDGAVRVSRVATVSGDGSGAGGVAVAGVPSTGPRGAEERLARVPEGDQLRIERYDASGEPPRFIVYVGPTETFSPVATDEPWDLTSNVTGVAGLSGGSLRATEAAMVDAGITSSDRVQFVGFSQGGLVAARLAASPEWNTAGLETYGAPAGNIELPEGIAGITVRNSDDFVPALAGPQLDHHLLQVERQAFAPGSPIPDGLPAPAHQRSAYVATAGAIDAARSGAVRDQIAIMDAFTSDYTSREGSSVTVMIYHAERGGAKGSGAATTRSGAEIP
jgi:hypothetical protein